ncbi:MAG: Gfo/Idh/MocA family oxidoreductase [Anaerolineae bacterium]|nr:Gfo/Idh/MocA family oxidoreductase [Anaerolineae bacterium]
MPKLRAVLMGTGNWAGAHAAAYAGCEAVELVGVSSYSNAGKLEAFAKEHGIAEYSLDLAALLRKTRPDILDIAAHPAYRLAGVRLATALPFIKLVNLEKPMALKPGDAYEIERLCREHGTLLTVNHQKKFLPAWRKAYDAIRSGAIGDFEFMHATCQGNLMVQGTHLSDMALFFNDYCPVSWVMAQVGELDDMDEARTPAPGAAIATVCFENGVRAVMTIGSVGRALPGEDNQWYQFGIDVYGASGRISVTLNKTLKITSYADGQTTVEESSWSKDYLHAQTAHLDAAARYAQNPALGHLSDMEKSSLSYQTVMAIYASGADGGVITLPRRFDDDLVARLKARKGDSGR